MHDKMNEEPGRAARPCPGSAHPPRAANRLFDLARLGDQAAAGPAAGRGVSGMARRVDWRGRRLPGGGECTGRATPFLLPKASNHFD